jgi:hypothetical protein
LAACTAVVVSAALARANPPAAAASAPATVGSAPIRTVEVRALRNPASWSYRDYLEGIETFDDERKLAPHGVLSFVLRPHGPLPANTVVSLEGETDSHELPRRGLRFQIPRLEHFDRSDVRLTVSVRGTEFGQDLTGKRSNVPRMLHKLLEMGRAPIAEVRTPGLPDNVYRLGDVRLGCRVSVTVFKEQAPWWVSAALTTGLGTRDWCSKSGGGTMISQPVDQPFVALTLRDGLREKRVTFNEPQHIIQIPSNPESWSDETLMTLEWAPPPGPESAPTPQPMTVRFGADSAPDSAPAPGQAQGRTQ